MIFATYRGGGYIHSVPARDLTEEEYRKYCELIEACPDQLYALVVREGTAADTEETEEDATGEL